MQVTLLTSWNEWKCSSWTPSVAPLIMVRLVYVSWRLASTIIYGIDFRREAVIEGKNYEFERSCVLFLSMYMCCCQPQSFVTCTDCSSNCNTCEERMKRIVELRKRAPVLQFAVRVIWFFVNWHTPKTTSFSACSILGYSTGVNDVQEPQENWTMPWELCSLNKTWSEHTRSRLT